MFRKIILTLLALCFIAGIVFGLWYLNLNSEENRGEKKSFIPHNSALVININGKSDFLPSLRKVVDQYFVESHNELMRNVVDTLIESDLIVNYPYAVASRIEGRSSLAFLYLFNTKDILQSTPVSSYMSATFNSSLLRSYEGVEIFTFKRGNEIVYFSVSGGIVLVSNSELYVEDGLRQFLNGREAGEDERYHNIDRFFSSSVNFNIFLNQEFFNTFLKLVVQTKRLSSHFDFTKLFQWGALDGDSDDSSLSINGFFAYDEIGESFASVLKGQEPREMTIDEILPSRLSDVTMLNVSDLSLFFRRLDDFREATRVNVKTVSRKSQYNKIFGKDYDVKLRDLLEGEFAQVTLSYNIADESRDGAFVVALKSGGLGEDYLKKILSISTQHIGKNLEDIQNVYKVDEGKSFVYYDFPVNDFPMIYFGELFAGIKSNYVLVLDNYLMFASSKESIKTLAKAYVHSNFLDDEKWYNELNGGLAKHSNVSFFTKLTNKSDYFYGLLNTNLQKIVKNKDVTFGEYQSLGFLLSSETDLLYSTLYMSAAKIESALTPYLMWKTQLGAKQTLKPAIVTSHIDNSREIFVQDGADKIYLINDIGRILWSLPIEGQINSTIYQVDTYKNGKLQYLFSTASKIYLVDRNGDNVGRFPINLKTNSKHGISVFDYEGDRNYRIFVPCEDKKVYLYDIEANIIKGWQTDVADKSIVSRVKHLSVGSKDYIIFADEHRVYILDRQGKVRVKVNTLLDLPEYTDFYYTTSKGVGYLVFRGKAGNIYKVNLRGKVSSVPIKSMESDARMNIGDIVVTNKDEELVFTSGSRVIVSDLSGKILVNKEITDAKLSYPYIYNFYNSDIGLGVYDDVNNQMYMLNNKGDVKKGFPISGFSPFSITLSNEGVYYLYAGAEGKSVIKYKIDK